MLGQFLKVKTPFLKFSILRHFLVKQNLKFIQISFKMTSVATLYYISADLDHALFVYLCLTTSKRHQSWVEIRPRCFMGPAWHLYECILLCMCMFYCNSTEWKHSFTKKKLCKSHGTTKKYFCPCSESQCGPKQHIRFAKNNFQNIFFYIPLKKLSNSGWKQHEAE